MRGITEPARAQILSITELYISMHCIDLPLLEENADATILYRSGMTDLRSRLNENISLLDFIF